MPIDVCFTCLIFHQAPVLTQGIKVVIGEKWVFIRHLYPYQNALLFTCYLIFL